MMKVDFRDKVSGRMRRVFLLTLILTVGGCAEVPEISEVRIPAPVSIAVASPDLPGMPGRCHGEHNSYQVKGKYYWIEDVVAEGYTETGKASWYGRLFHGKKTASGELFNMYELSAAHKTLPMFSIVEVINLENDKQIIVRINDRGPFVDERLIDLSYAAAEKIGMVKTGVVPVKITVKKESHANGFSALAPETYTN